MRTGTPARGPPACQSCRVRHLQCDGDKPFCGQCRVNHRRCVPYFNVRFTAKRNRKVSDNINNNNSNNSNNGNGNDNRRSGPSRSIARSFSSSPMFRSALSGIHRVERNVVSEEPERIITPLDSPTPAPDEQQQQPLGHCPGISTPPMLDVGWPARQRQQQRQQQDQEQQLRQQQQQRRRLQLQQLVLGSPSAGSELSPTGSALSPAGSVLSPASPEPNVQQQPPPWTGPIIHAAEDNDNNNGDQEENLQANNKDMGLFSYSQSHSPVNGNPPATPALSEVRSQLYTSSPDLPMTNRRHAVLLQHFKSVLGGPWLDITDPFFSTEVTRLAPYCPVLLFSVLALSSFDVSRRCGSDFGEAEEFHILAVRILLSLLNDRSTLADGSVLASTVILRLFEEFAAMKSGHDTESHLLGGYVFVTIAQDSRAQWSSLGKAAFWIHQRQDVLSSLLRQIPPRADATLSSRYHPTDKSDIYAWTKKSTALASEVAGLCFGEDPPSTFMYEQLQEKLEEWYNTKPDAFTPLYYRERNPVEGRYFPEVKFSVDSCLTGFAYYHLSLLLMANYDPRGPKLGSQAVAWQQSIQIKNQDLVRLLCGVARSNSCPLGCVIATLAIVHFGAWFVDDNERAELLEILQLTENDHGWPGFFVKEDVLTDTMGDFSH